MINLKVKDGSEVKALFAKLREESGLTCRGLAKIINPTGKPSVGCITGFADSSRGHGTTILTMVKYFGALGYDCSVVFTKKKV